MPSTSSLHRARQVCAGLILGIVFLLAVLAGRFLFLGDLIIELHGYIGNGVFVLALVNLGLALRARASGPDTAVAFAIVLLVFAQIGLGYVGRDTADAAAIHIPNGVLLMGLAGYQFATTRVAATTPAA